MALLDKLQKLEVEDTGMASLPKIIHPGQRGATLDELLDVPKPAVVTVRPTEVKSAWEQDFDEIEVIGLLKKKNCKVHICFGITSSILRRTDSVFNTVDGLNRSARPCSQSSDPTASNPSTTCHIGLL